MYEYMVQGFHAKAKRLQVLCLSCQKSIDLLHFRLMLKIIPKHNTAVLMYSVTSHQMFLVIHFSPHTLRHTFLFLIIYIFIFTIAMFISNVIYLDTRYMNLKYIQGV